MESNSKAHEDSSWTVSAMTPEASDSAEVKIGELRADGTIYAGISPDTRKPMYATPRDAPLTYTFDQANLYAARLDVHGHQDWRVPTKNELNVLFENRAAVGGFNTSGSDPGGWYASSSSEDRTGWIQRFSDGFRLNSYKFYDSSLRCVR